MLQVNPVICAVPGVEQCDFACRGYRLYLFHVKWMEHLIDGPETYQNFVRYVAKFFYMYDPSLVSCRNDDGDIMSFGDNCSSLVLSF